MLARVRAQLSDIVPSGSRIVVALSGGIDSIVLLDVMRRIAARRRWRLSALHVNHQLQDAAPQWVQFCRRLCRARGVPLRVVKVDVPRGNSVERAAREARYGALLRARADFIALAHNRDDQAETLLLHLLRGAGIRGLAGMRVVADVPALTALEGVTDTPRLLRPLLDVPRSDIRAYAERRKLAWIDDPSNAATDYTRNFLRIEVMPRISERFPAYREALARTGRHATEAGQLLDELAQLDGSPGDATAACPLAVLRALSVARAKNVLRHFLQQHGIEIASADRLEEAVRQLRAARSDARVAIRLGTRDLRVHRGAVVLTANHVVPCDDVWRTWRGEDELSLPEWGGRLLMERARGNGLSLARLSAAAVTIRPRKGGERLRPHASGMSRTVKNLMQEAGMPAWERERVPLIYCGEELVCVPGIATAGAYRGAAREACVVPVWRPG